MFRYSTAALALWAAAAAPVLAAGQAPSSIVAAPASFEGKTVTVTGKVAHFQTTKTPMGTVAAFQLCDTKCVVVIDETNGSKYGDGDTGTATGTFHQKFKGRMRSFDNVVIIK